MGPLENATSQVEKQDAKRRRQSVRRLRTRQCLLKGCAERRKVVAPHPIIERTVTALHDRFRVEYVAPGHCTGEPAFTALKKAFGDHYMYAGLGTTRRATQVGNQR
jgi:hypothetical protein